MHKFVMMDLGPKVRVWSARVRDDTVCVMTPASLKDAFARRKAREMMKRQGVDCGTCRGCPLGRAD